MTSSELLLHHVLRLLELVPQLFQLLGPAQTQTLLLVRVALLIDELFLRVHFFNTVPWRRLLWNQTLALKDIYHLRNFSKLKFSILDRMLFLVSSETMWSFSKSLRSSVIWTPLINNKK